MNQLRRLLLNRSHHFGMTMARRNHRDSRSKVEELVSIRIFQANSTPALGHQRIGARIARRDQPMVGFNNSPRLRSRQRANQFRSKLRIHLFLICRVLTYRILTHGTFSSAGSVAAAWQPTRLLKSSEYFVSDAARPRIPSKGIAHNLISQVCGSVQEPYQARVFGGGLLIAAEEARSSAGRQHAQVFPRADATRARPRPALCSRRDLKLKVCAHLHGLSADSEDPTQLE